MILVASPELDKLIAEGKVINRVDISRTGIGIAVKKGAPKPDVSTPEALKRTLARGEIGRPHRAGRRRHHGAASAAHLREARRRQGGRGQDQARGRRASERPRSRR